jgi:hypothetical protein
MNEGAGAGIKVAKSQSGGAAPASNMSSDTGSSAAQDISNIAKNNDTGSEQAEVAEKAKIGSNATAEGNVPSSSNQGGSLGGALNNIGNIGGGDAGADAGADAGDSAGSADASAAADAAGSIVSDENTKSAKNVSSDKKDKSKVTDKLGAVRSYGAGVGQGFANAGAIATGNSDAVEWKDIQVAKAKEAAEDTVKNWKKQRQEANKEQKPATTAEGK